MSLGLPRFTAALCPAQAAAAVAVLGLGLLGTAVFNPWLLGLALALLLLGLVPVVSAAGAACCLLRLWLCQLGLWRCLLWADVPRATVCSWLWLCCQVLSQLCCCL